MVVDLPDAHIAGGTADVFLVQGSVNPDSLISKANISGGVVLTGIKSDRYKFDRAETASANYTASDGIIVLASPVTCWFAGKKVPIESKDIRIDTRNSPAPTTPPAPANVTPAAGASGTDRGGSAVP